MPRLELPPEMRKRLCALASKHRMTAQEYMHHAFQTAAENDESLDFLHDFVRLPQVQAYLDTCETNDA